MKIFILLLFLPLYTTVVLGGSPLEDLQWRVVNDTVMGGVSTSSVSIVDEKTRFAGVLSLENNGGFASMRTANLGEVDPESTEVILTVIGDGRTYLFDLRNSSRRSAFSYRNSFETLAGEEVTVRLPVKDFVATHFGRRLPNMPGLSAAEIEAVGITLADGSPGPFRLDILDIRFDRTEITADTVSDGQALIEKAISMGVPMYNDGEVEACAMIYEMTLQSFLLEDHPEISVPQQNSLRDALSGMPADMDARAWSLRRELDRLHSELEEMRL